MSIDITELKKLFSSVAEDVSYKWQSWNDQRQSKINDWKEIRDYVFATDTRTTTNANLPWKNSTTTPKLCQIRDNLHANYISALFPNDYWMKWEAGTEEASLKDKAEGITAYMTTKTRESGFRDVVSRLVYDFIDYGNAFAEVDYVHNRHIDSTTGLPITIFEGPVSRRISPYDIVFNPLSPSFDESPKIIRKLVGRGELVNLAAAHEEFEQALQKHKLLTTCVGGYSIEDFNKEVSLSVDGFGNAKEYVNSDYVELLEFRGDYYDSVEQKVLTNRSIMVIDRKFLVWDKPIDNWLGKTSILHCGWRYRPDNLWAMGPLDNLVGLQYRIDHLENLKADAMDLAVHPPLVIKGDVDEFDYYPGCAIPIPEGGEIVELGKNLNSIITADQQIMVYENKMEEFAGAPKQAMGIRTPGEKTAFEVQQLQNAAGRIFQEKVTLFEVNMLEPLLNLMLECARRNLAGSDIVKSFDDDLGVETFLTVTQGDITARGKLRPIGARHFGEKAQLISNLSQLFSSPLGQMVAPHVSAKNLAYLVEDALQIDRWDVIRPNVGQVEAADNANMASNLEQAVMEQQSVQY